MRVLIDSFGGIAPQVGPTRLAENMAIEAMNVRFERQVLESFRGLSATGISLPANTKHIYRYGTAWMGWADANVRAVDASQVSDPFDYLLIADTDYPKITRNDIATSVPPYPTATYRLGVPKGRLGIAAPQVSRIPSLPKSPELGVDIETTTAYQFSFVNGFGFEGALSDPTGVVKYFEGFDSITVELPTIFPGNGHYLIGAKVRIYRVNGFGTEFQFVAEVPLGTTTYTDVILAKDLGLPSETADWFPPPDDDTTINPAGPLRNLTPMPGGFFIGSTGDELCASVIDAPYAWPYRISLGYDITGIAVMGNAAVVATTGPAFVVQGVDPSSLQPTRINTNQTCVSARSMVNIGDSVIYAAPDGLVSVSGYSAEVITENLVTKEEWQRIFKPSQIHAYYYEGKYIFFNNTNGYVLSPGKGLRSLGELDFVATAGFSELEDDNLYLMVGGVIKQFDSNAVRMQYKWTSKHFTFPTPLNFGYMQVVAEAYPVTVHFNYQKLNGQWHRDTLVFTNYSPRFLPSGSSYQKLFFEAVGVNAIQSITVAHSLSEFEYV